MTKKDVQLKDWFAWAIKGNYVKIKESTYMCARKTAEHDMTALMYAAVYGHVEIVRALVTLEAGIKNSYGFTALMLAVLRDDVEPFQMTPDDATENTYVSLDRRYSYLTRKQHRQEIMSELIDSEADIRDIKGRTALMLAAEHGNRDAVEFLLNRRVEMTMDHGWNPLMHAIIRQSVLDFDKFYDMYKNKKNAARQTPLMQAAMMGNMYMVERLLENGVKKQDIRGLSALILAAKANQPAIVKILKNKEARLRDKVGMTALMYSSARGFSEIVELLHDVEEGLQDAHGWTALMYTCLSNSMSSAKLLRPSECHITDSSRITALMYSAVLNRTELVKFLLDELVLKTDLDGTTALMYAAVFNRLEIVQLLANYESKFVDTNGLTALHHAVIHNHLEVVKLLVQTEYSMRDAKGKTALYHAVELGHLDLVPILSTLEKDGPLPSGWTRLMICAIANQVDYLTTYISEAKSFNQNGETALMLAVQYSTIDVFQALLQYEVSLINTKTGKTALMYAVTSERENLVPLLLPYENRMQDKEGMTATMIAVCTNKISILKILLTIFPNIEDTQMPFEVGMKDVNGQTALMKAAMLKNEVAVKLLLPFEAGLQDKNGRAAIMYAQNSGATDIVLILLTFEREIRDVAGCSYQDYQCGAELDFMTPLTSTDMKQIVIQKNQTMIPRNFLLDPIQEETITTYRTSIPDESTQSTSFTFKRNADIADDDLHSIVRIGLSIDASSRITENRDMQSTPRTARLSSMNNESTTLEHIIDGFEQTSLDTPRIIYDIETNRLNARVSSLLNSIPYLPENLTSETSATQSGIIKSTSKDELPDLTGYTIKMNTSPQDSEEVKSPIVGTSAKIGKNDIPSHYHNLSTIREDSLAKSPSTCKKDSNLTFTEHNKPLPLVPIIDAPVNIPYALIRENGVIYKVPIHSGKESFPGMHPSSDCISSDYQSSQPELDFPPFPAIEASPYSSIGCSAFPPLSPPCTQQPLEPFGETAHYYSTIHRPSLNEQRMLLFARPCRHIFSLPCHAFENGYIDTWCCPICGNEVAELVCESES